MTPGPWRKRCPEGHAAVKRRQTGGYYCQSCQVRYAGEPHDAADSDDDTPAVTWSYKPLEALAMLYDQTRDTKSAVRARRVSDHPNAFAQTLRILRNRGLVEQVSESVSAGRYRVTETGERIATNMVPPEGDA